MKITEIRIHLVKAPRSKILANASVTFDDAMVIHDFKIIAGARGPFVGVPSKQIQSVFRDMVQIIRMDIRDLIFQEIMRAYQDEMAKPENSLGEKKP